MVGFLGVATASLFIGLALVALNKEQAATTPAWVAFGLAALFLLFFLSAWVYLYRCQVVINRKIREVGRLVRDGLALRNRILDGKIDDAAIDEAMNEWQVNVRKWISRNESDYLTDFWTATPGVGVGVHVLGMSPKATRVVQDIDARNGAIQGLLRDLRASR